MRIFVFEYLTGGGLLAAGRAGRAADERSARRLDSGMLAEGVAMVAALAADFAALADCDVHVFARR